MNARQPQPCPDMVCVKLSNEAVFSKEQIARFFGDSLDFKGHTEETHIILGYPWLKERAGINPLFGSGEKQEEPTEDKYKKLMKSIENLRKAAMDFKVRQEEE